MSGKASEMSQSKVTAEAHEESLAAARAAGVGEDKTASVGRGGGTKTLFGNVSGLAVAEGEAEVAEGRGRGKGEAAQPAAQEARSEGYDETGERMLQAEDAFSQAWAKRDASKLRALLADGAVLHADGLVMEQDITGAEAIADLCKRYFERYTYQSRTVVRAVCTESRTAFGLFQDENLRRVDGEGQTQVDSAVAGMWKLKLEPQGSQQYRIKDIWLLRQLNAEEKRHRLHDESSCKGEPLDAAALKQPRLQPSQQRTDAMRHAAELYSEIWQRGHTDLAERILKPDIKSVDLLHGGVKSDRDSFVQMIKQVYKGWHPRSSSIDIAVTPTSNKAFVHWTANGVLAEEEGSDGKQTTVSGMTLLVFDPEDNLIQETLGLRQLFPNERSRMLKAGPLMETLRTEA